MRLFGWQIVLPMQHGGPSLSARLKCGGLVVRRLRTSENRARSVTTLPDMTR